MARPGTQRAIALLDEVAARHEMPVEAFLEGARIAALIIAKKEFCRLGIKAGISSLTLGAVIKLDHSTVLYHASIERQARKKQTRTRRRMESGHAEASECGGDRSPLGGGSELGDLKQKRYA